MGNRKGEGYASRCALGWCMVGGFCWAYLAGGDGP